MRNIKMQRTRQFLIKFLATAILSPALHINAEPAEQKYQSIEPSASESRYIGKTFVFMFNREHCRHPNIYSIIQSPSVFDTRRTSATEAQEFTAQAIVKGLEGASSRYIQIHLQDGSQGYIDTLHFKVEPDSFENLTRKGCSFAGTSTSVQTRVSDAQAQERSQEQARQIDLEKQRAAAAEEERQRIEQAKRPGARIGMTTKEVVEKTNWGKPQEINRTVTAGTIREQWVYGSGDYLYFINGRLQAIQARSR